MIKRYLKKTLHLYKYHIQKDVFTREVTQWFKDTQKGGGESLRYDYPELNENAVVFDLGGYKGDFASNIHDKYKCTIYVFEPHPVFYRHCVERFQDNDKIIPFNFGISDVTGSFDISDDADASSFLHVSSADQRAITCKIKEFCQVLKDLNVHHIDLIKINIEGGEYPLLEYLIKKNMLHIARAYQIQFHNFVDDAEHKYNFITHHLSKTHMRTWCYKFVWENWHIIDSKNTI